MDALGARIDLLESQILRLMSFKDHYKKKTKNGYQSFKLSMTHHVTTQIYYDHVRTHGITHFKPTYTQVLQEISRLWNNLGLELQSHWDIYALETHTH